MKFTENEIEGVVISQRPDVLLESEAVGRICIASKINRSKEVGDDGITGYLFEKGNSNDLINKVEKFLALDYETKNRWD